MLVITSGDPLSITVEILTPLLHAPRYRQHGAVVIGSAWQWRDQAKRLGLSLPQMQSVTSLAQVKAGALAMLDVGTDTDALPAEQLTPAQRGAVSMRALEWLKSDHTGGPLAVVTGPIDKHACHLAGYPYPGQTEFFEAMWGSTAVMTLAGPRLRVGLVTNHVALKDVAARFSIELVQKKLTLFVKTLRESFHIAAPRIAVCGVNPHASDNGLFGREEELYLVPAIAAVRDSEPQADITGPVPADTAFYRAYHGVYDGVLAMYHDQGLGPLKTVHFDDAVNLSGGLTHFRVSPDHGPARDRFLQRTASPESFTAAMDLASRYLEEQ